MKRYAIKGLCTFLALLTLLQGCSTVDFKYHEFFGDRCAVKIFPYWVGDDGEKYLVGGLRVELHPRESQYERTFQEITSTATRLVFDDLKPGRYRLKVYIEGGIKVSDTIELLPGRSLTVRIDVEGVKSKEAFKDSLENIGETIGKTFVIIGTVVVVIAVVALNISLEESRDDRGDPR